MSSDNVERLKVGLKRLSRRNGWTQDVFARDASGAEVYSNDPCAVCFCALGALDEEIDADNIGAVEFLHRAIGGSQAIDRWNDHPERTKSEVVAAFKRAIKLAEAAHASP